MLNTGAMRDKIRFERRAADENGDPSGDWQEIVTLSAQIVWLRGDAQLLAQRLQGLQPAVFKVRACAESRALDNTCRAVDARILNPQKGDYFAIKAVNLSADRADVEVLAERGKDG